MICFVVYIYIYIHTLIEFVHADGVQYGRCVGGRGLRAGEEDGVVARQGVQVVVASQGVTVVVTIQGEEVRYGEIKGS